MRSATGVVVGSTLAFAAAPGTVAGLLPWLISRWELNEPLPYWIAAQVLGALLLTAGVVMLVNVVVRFALARGTLAPVAPPERLVVSGANRFVRNPMYVAVLAAVLGQALLFGSAGVALYFFGVWAVFATFVKLYEEPTLARQFGEEYAEYRAAVPAWIPRLRPWEPVGV